MHCSDHCTTLLLLVSFSDRGGSGNETILDRELGFDNGSVYRMCQYSENLSG